MGRISDAIGVLDEGLRTRSEADEPFRRAAVYWNRACYKCLRDMQNVTSESVTSVVEDLRRAVHNAPEYAESLQPKQLDPDLAPLVGHPIFESWRASALARKGKDP
jgi:hypothetical protein